MLEILKSDRKNVFDVPIIKLKTAEERNSVLGNRARVIIAIKTQRNKN